MAPARRSAASHAVSGAHRLGIVRLMRRLSESRGSRLGFKASILAAIALTAAGCAQPIGNSSPEIATTSDPLTTGLASQPPVQALVPASGSLNDAKADLVDMDGKKVKGHPQVDVLTLAAVSDGS